MSPGCCPPELAYRAMIESFVILAPSGAFWLKKLSSSSLMAAAKAAGVVAPADATEEVTGAGGAVRKSPNGSLLSALLALLVVLVVAVTSEILKHEDKTQLPRRNVLINH